MGSFNSLAVFLSFLSSVSALLAVMIVSTFGVFCAAFVLRAVRRFLVMAESTI